MYENIRKHLCNKIMNADDNELGQLAHALLYAQHFTTFTLPRKLMKLVYTRPELSPLDFLRFGP